MDDEFRRASHDEWFTVVDSAPVDEAARSWRAWCDAQSEIPDDDDIRIDTGRADYGPFARYSVRRSAMPGRGHGYD